MSTITAQLQPERCVLSVQRRMRPEEMDQVISSTVAELRALAATAGLQQTDDPFGIFHGQIDGENDGPLEIVLPVDGLTDVEGEPRSYRLPGGQFAVRTAVGEETDFPAILAVYDELHGWIEQGGHTPVGPPREIWHNSPSSPEPLRLTIAWRYAG